MEITGNGGPAVVPLTGNGQTITANAPLINVSQTWNNAAVNFNAVSVNVTNTASGGNSTLINMMVGGVPTFIVSTGGSITAGGNISVGTANFLLFTGRGRITPQADGVWTFFNNATTGFGRLQFGGTTTAFPALRPIGSRLAVRLADDSGDANLSCATITTAASFTVATLPAPGTVGFGTRAMVTDAAAPAFGVIAVGGGAATVPVYSDGTSWRCG